MIETHSPHPLEGGAAAFGKTPGPTDSLVRAAAGAAMLSISIAQFYKLAAENADFPASVVVSSNVRAYWVSELMAWAKQRPRGNDETTSRAQRANLEKSPYRRKAKAQHAGEREAA